MVYVYMTLNSLFLQAQVTWMGRRVPLWRLSAGLISIFYIDVPRTLACSLCVLCAIAATVTSLYHAPWLLLHPGTICCSYNYWYMTVHLCTVRNGYSSCYIYVPCALRTSIYTVDSSFVISQLCPVSSVAIITHLDNIHVAPRISWMY